MVPHVKPQNVAEHSFHVLWIYFWLYEKYAFNTPSFFDAMRVLAHDADEAMTGDHPSPTKGLPDTSEAMQNKCWVKIADCLEMDVFLREEKALGNSAIDDIQKDNSYRAQCWVDKLKTFGCTVPKFDKLADTLWDEIKINKHVGLRGVEYAR